MFGATRRPVPTGQVDGNGNDVNFSMAFFGSPLAVGDNTIRTPGAGKTLTIYRITGLSGSATVFLVTDGAGGTQVARDNILANGRINFDFTPNGVQLSPGNALILNSSIGATVHMTVVGTEY